MLNGDPFVLDAVLPATLFVEVVVVTATATVVVLVLDTVDPDFSAAASDDREDAADATLSLDGDAELDATPSVLVVVVSLLARVVLGWPETVEPWLMVTGTTM